MRLEALSPDDWWSSSGTRPEFSARLSSMRCRCGFLVLGVWARRLETPKERSGALRGCIALIMLVLIAFVAPGRTRASSDGELAASHFVRIGAALAAIPCSPRPKRVSPGSRGGLAPQRPLSVSGFAYVGSAASRGDPSAKSDEMTEVRELWIGFEEQEEHWGGYTSRTLHDTAARLEPLRLARPRADRARNGVRQLGRTMRSPVQDKTWTMGSGLVYGLRRRAEHVRSFGCEWREQRHALVVSDPTLGSRSSEAASSICSPGSGVFRYSSRATRHPRG